MLAEAMGIAAAGAVSAASGLTDRLGCLTVATLGPEGAIAFGPDQAWRVDALAIEARDTTGAGDTFAGVFAAALDAGASVAEALARASVAGGLACREIGAQQSMPSAAMIEARLGDIGPASPARRDDT